MKIRWNSKSVRLRISPSELETLQRRETVVEVMEFGNGSWEAYLSVGEETQFWIEKMMLQISISGSALHELADPKNEGVYFVTGGPPQAPHPIKYFIEKDFPCAHPRTSQAEEKAETFAPTREFESRKNTARSRE
jgi:hypothetical protein